MKGLRTLLLAALSFCAVFSLSITATAEGATTHPVEVRVILSHDRVVAGQSIKGTVVLTNTTPKRILVNTCAANGWLAVGLRGRVDSYPFAHTLIGCVPTVGLAPGTNRFPVMVITTYASCIQPQPAGSTPPSRSSPTCTVAGPPPLPAGNYTTKVDIVGLHDLTQAAKRVVVHLTKPRHPPRLAPCADQPGKAPKLETVPNVVGANSLAAALPFAKACLNAQYASPTGNTVISEAPTAGSKVPEHSTVILTTR